MQTNLLEGRVAAVTGAASGIGRAIATTLAEHGADTVVADIREQPRSSGVPTHEKIRLDTESSAEFVKCDVTNQSNLERVVEVAETFGPIDIMVHNAGIIEKEDFLEATPEDYGRILTVNAKGAYFGSQAAASRMVETDGGSIINISSTAGLAGAPVSVSYSASKGAVRLMTYAIAAQLGHHGIRANVIHPGTVETRMNTDDLAMNLDDEQNRQDIERNIASDRIGRPEDIANVALFLASDLAGFVNAESVVVDGGRHNTNLF